MARRSTAWLTEMAASMREVGAIAATRRITHKNGDIEEYQLELGPAPNPLLTKLQREVVESYGGTPAPISEETLGNVEMSAEELLLAGKVEMYRDIFGRELSPEQLAQLPDNPL